MSDRNYLRSKLPASGSTALLPGTHVQMRPFRVQTKATDPQQASRLDVGLMQNLGLQTKLTVGQPGDKYEQEADTVAAKVVQQINSPQAQQKRIQREAMPEEEEKAQMKPLADSIQRQENAEEEELQQKPLADTIQREEMPEEEEKAQMKPLIQRQGNPEEEEQIQAKPLAGTIQREEIPEEEEKAQMKPMLQRQAAGAAAPQVESAISSARGQGQPLSEDVRGSMEGAFGTDFGGVRVHTDERSDQLNGSLRSRAFTTGQDIFFKKGEFNPGSHSGQELLAHELTHVVQQVGPSREKKSNKTKINPELQLQTVLRLKNDFQKKN